GPSSSGGITFTASSAGPVASGTSGNVVINAGNADHFRIVNAIASPQAAGVGFYVRIEARDVGENIDTGYNVAGIVLEDSDGTPNPTFSPAIINFTSGVWEGTVTVTEATPITVRVGQGSGLTVDTAGPITINPGAISYFTISGEPASTIAGHTLADPIPGNITVTAYDQYDNIKTNYTGTIQFRTSDPNVNGNVVLKGQPIPAGLQTDIGTQYTFLVGDAGTHNFDRATFTLETKGNQTITIYDTVKTSIQKTSNLINVLPDGIAMFTLTAPATVTAGSSFALNVSNARDAVGNLTDGTIAVSFTDAGLHQAPDGSNPTLNNITVTSGSGSAIQTLVLAEGPVVNMLTGTDTVTSATATTGNITIDAGAIHHFTFTTQPAATVTANVAIPVVIEAGDMYDNLLDSGANVYNGTATVRDTTDTVDDGVDDQITFVAGVFNNNLFVRDSHSNDVIVVRNNTGTQTGSSSSFTAVFNHVTMQLVDRMEPKFASEGSFIRMFDARITNSDLSNDVTLNGISARTGTVTGGTTDWTVLANTLIDSVTVYDVTSGSEVSAGTAAAGASNQVDVVFGAAITIPAGSSVTLRFAVTVSSSLSGALNLMLGYADINGTRPPNGAVIAVNDLTQQIPVNDPVTYPAYFIRSGITQLRPAGATVDAFNYPNPFNPRRQTTKITFYCPTGSTTATVKIYTLTGKLVKTITQPSLIPGQCNEIEWDGRNGKGQVVRNGVYVAVLQVDGTRAMVKIAVVK
ncbi:MAG: hypothetical protein JXQ30_11680, partial [Spirochaetes bacterium]|nr:hypothetical protein [Spirochaetota bacterium]